MNRALHDLEALAGMVFDAELAKLDAISKDLAQRKAELAALAFAQSARSDALNAGRAGEDLAFLTGQDARWSRWVSETGAQLSGEVARIAARREEQRLRAQKAFGKQDALRQLRARDAAARHKKRNGPQTD